MSVRIVVLLCALASFGVGLVIVNEVAKSRSDEQRANAVAGCERTNVLRRQLHGFLVDAAETRRATAHGADRVSNLHAARRYERRARSLVEAAAEYPKRPGSPQVDCDDAF